MSSTTQVQTIRTKKVFTDISAICHIFANRSQDEARTPSNNFSVRGKYIYSYATCIGKHETNENGENAILISEHRYSNTTAKQQSALRQACSYKNVIYCEYANEGTESNFRYWLNEVENAAYKLKTARKKEIYLNQIAQLKNKATVYSNFMCVEIPATLAAAFDITDGARYAEYVSKRNALREQEIEAAQKLLEKKHKKELTEWKAGKTHRMYSNIGIDFLRVNADNTVHTTQGVTIPKANALQMYYGLKSKAITTGMQIADVNGHTYTVNAIDAKNIVIGCHKFKVSYLLSFGAKLAKI